MSNNTKRTFRSRAKSWPHLKYFIDKKAKLCFGGALEAASSISCQNLADGYPELRRILGWVK